MLKIFSYNIVTKFLLIISLLFVSGCRYERNETNIINIPEDIPFSEFITGRWKYEGKYYYEGYGYSDIYWEYTFVDEKIIKIWTGNDGGTCAYKFIEPEVISIDCSPRMTEVMEWSVKREGQFLLIQRLENGQLKGGEQLRFERVAER